MILVSRRPRSVTCRQPIYGSHGADVACLAHGQSHSQNAHTSRMQLRALLAASRRNRSGAANASPVPWKATVILLERVRVERWGKLVEATNEEEGGTSMG